LVIALITTLVLFVPHWHKGWGWNTEYLDKLNAVPGMYRKMLTLHSSSRIDAQN